MSPSKLGRNPLNKKRSTPVSNIIERDHSVEIIDEAAMPVIKESRDLYGRLKQMEIELDWQQVVRRLYRRIKGRPA